MLAGRCVAAVVPAATYHPPPSVLSPHLFFYMVQQYDQPIPQSRTLSPLLLCTQRCCTAETGGWIRIRAVVAEYAVRPAGTLSKGRGKKREMVVKKRRRKKRSSSILTGARSKVNISLIAEVWASSFRVMVDDEMLTFIGAELLEGAVVPFLP